MKKLAFVLGVALAVYAAYGWVMGCCPGVPACGGCHAMNWERLAFMGFMLLIVVAAMVYWLIRKILIYPFGPPLCDEDQCSTTNPERDYERRD